MAALENQDVESPCLPDDLVESILTLLPPKEIVNLSVMSERYRNTWRSSRNISFDRNFAQNYTMREYINIIKHFFHFRANTDIDRFKLFLNPKNVRNLVCSWIDKCADLGIKHLKLDFSLSSGRYVLGSSLLQVETLRVLSLINVELDMSKLSSDFVSNLTEFRIRCATAQQSNIEKTFSNCLQLQTFEIVKCNLINLLDINAQNHKGFKQLVVKHYHNIRTIRINAPTLCTLHYHGKICEFIFKCVFPTLEDVILDITPSTEFQMFPHTEDLVVAIKNVRTLTVTSPFLEMLYQYRDLEFSLINLTEFHLIVRKESCISPFDIAMFLRKCPRIERVFIDVGQNSLENRMFWDLYGRARMSQLRITFPFIKSVKIKGFKLKDPHATMVRFFSNFAKNMEHLVLIKARNYDFPNIFTPVRMRWGIESHAQIEVYEHRGDRSAIFPKYFRNA